MSSTAPSAVRRRLQFGFWVADPRRLVCLLVVVSMLVYAVPLVVQWRESGDRVAQWWNVLVLVLTVGGFVAALACRERLAAASLWLAAVVGALTLRLAVDGTLEDQTWVAELSPMIVGLTVVLSRRAVLCAGAAVAVLVAGGSARSALVPVPASENLARLLLIVAIWGCSLALLRALEMAQRRIDEAQHAVVGEFVAARAAEATVRAEQAWDAYLHDEVVAGLATISGGDAASARQEAERLVQTHRAMRASTVPTPWLGAGSLDSVLRLRPDADTWLEIDPEIDSVPDEVRRAMLEALSEALRNVDRHAYGPGGAGPCRVEVRLDDREARMSVADQGRGFDPAAVGESRMGIAVSIEARMDAVGGWSQVHSAPGLGTRVELGWSRPEVRRA